MNLGHLACPHRGLQYFQCHPSQYTVAYRCRQLKLGFLPRKLAAELQVL